MLWYITVYYCILLYVTVWLWYVSVCYSILLCVTVHYGMLLYATVHYDVVTVCYCIFRCGYGMLLYVMVSYITVFCRLSLYYSIYAAIWHSSCWTVVISSCRADDESSSRWYYWKLKPSLVTVGTKLFVWIGYSLHNLSVWLVLYLQQKSKVNDHHPPSLCTMLFTTLLHHTALSCCFIIPLNHTVFMYFCTMYTCCSWHFFIIPLHHTVCVWRMHIIYHTFSHLNAVIHHTVITLFFYFPVPI